jgi:hypothetical protein
MFNVRIWGPYLVDIAGDGKRLVYMAMYDVNVRFSENLQMRWEELRPTNEDRSKYIQHLLPWIADITSHVRQGD